MKNISKQLITLLKRGYCTPKIARIAFKLKQPSTTIHYNIKKLEKEGVIKAYKAVLDYNKAGEGFCSFVLINISSEEYNLPEKIAKEIAKYPEVESVDIITGDWELIIKVRTKNKDEYYNFVKRVLAKEGIKKIKSLISLKQIKTEFVEIE